MTSGGMDKRKAGIQCRRTEERKTAEYRGEQNIRKGRDVDVRNGREMVAGLSRNWASTTPTPFRGGHQRPFGVAVLGLGGWGFALV